MSDSNNFQDFDKPDNRSGLNGWMWALYIVTGLFVVCLLIWMFVALSKHEIIEQKDNPFTEVVIPAETVPSSAQ